ncbi:unnamed protein product [Oikopleura dioica]|uniref:Uncharacterized protein n=1 Tax=Oikopleura dioica TaxID=34765 RepID=E4XXZ6_OIKDI|nr:unnamed protein product [Oikopleura dioica]
MMTIRQKKTQQNLQHRRQQNSSTTTNDETTTQAPVTTTTTKTEEPEDSNVEEHSSNDQLEVQPADETVDDDAEPSNDLESEEAKDVMEDESKPTNNASLKSNAEENDFLDNTPEEFGTAENVETEVLIENSSTGEAIGEQDENNRIEEKIDDEISENKEESLQEEEKGTNTMEETAEENKSVGTSESEVDEKITQSEDPAVEEKTEEEILAHALISAMKAGGGLDIQNSIQALLNLQKANQIGSSEEIKSEENYQSNPTEPADEQAKEEENDTIEPEETNEITELEEKNQISEHEETSEPEETPIKEHVTEAPVEEESSETMKEPALKLTSEFQRIPVSPAIQHSETNEGHEENAADESEAANDSIPEAPESSETLESLEKEYQEAVESPESLEQVDNDLPKGSEDPAVPDLLAKSEQKIEGFDGLSDAQQAQILEFIKNSVLPNKKEESPLPVVSDERMEDDEDNNEPIHHPVEDLADMGFESPEDVVQPPKILISPSDIQPEKIDSILYEDKGGKIVEYDDDEYNNAEGDESYVEPDANELELMSWEKEKSPSEIPKVEKLRTPPPSIFKHYDPEPQYDSLKAVGSLDHYIDIQTELESSGDHSEIMEEIFHDKPNEMDSIFDIPQVEVAKGSKLQLEDLIFQKKDLHEDKYRALEREEVENTKASHKGWMVFMMLIGILFIATTRRKVRRLIPASTRQRSPSLGGRPKGPLIAEKTGKDSSSEDEGDISGFEDF